ncbi:hypothetical protein ARALYDRAFT_904939 [Arabidopsis lyrata subsp. lyrata]|uniref:Uncharacterized protein n=1 Tax=Arabidopsis lyrata subsp. lyrata TaxID=81972 RepID=D7LLX8_ARALL|nr:hypothetical protein ARALYDRAFT_904939 [Arabidopsis lyrata subsp. lyrata]
MESGKDKNNDFPLKEILLRLPIRSIAKFKSVCKRWKLLVESATFRSLFMSLHKKSSCSWSLLTDEYPFQEHIALNNCKRWGLPRSLSSYILSPPILDTEFDLKSFQIRASASGLLLIRLLDNIYYVGNPLLRKWVKIRPCTLSLETYYYSNICGLATRVENDAVLGYKVILLCTEKFQEASNLSFQVYSSETGKWTHSNRTGYMIVLDFYNERANRCHAISFPTKAIITSFDKRYPEKWSRSACTTSGGFIMYIEATTIYEDHRLKVWKLNGLLRWDLSWEINLRHIEFGITSSPLAMHPFDTDILYLMSLEKKCMMSINLRTQKSMLHKDSEDYSHDDCNINFFKCPTVMVCTDIYLYWQFVPTLWIDDVPVPPPCAHCGRP